MAWKRRFRNRKKI